MRLRVAQKEVSNARSLPSTPQSGRRPANDLDPNFSPSQLAELYGVSRQRVWALAKLYNVQLKGMNRAKRT